jgi:hypothetical protein
VDEDDLLASLVGQTITAASSPDGDTAILTLGDGRRITFSVEGGHLEGGGWVAVGFLVNGETT